jgi:hypothetical protein
MTARGCVILRAYRHALRRKLSDFPGQGNAAPQLRDRDKSGGCGRARLQRLQHPAEVLPELAACIGGQGTEPKEQKTQQSPALGRSTAPHPSHE